MDNVKKKFQSFVKSKASTASLGSEQDINHSSFGGDAVIAIHKFKEHITESHDPRIDQENIDSIEKVYFNSDDSFDSSEYELKKIESGVRQEQIEVRRALLKKQLKSVSKRVSELILENHPAYATELRRVMELQESLNVALDICTDSRSSLQNSRKEFTTASLLMLANHRKRQQLQGLMRSLRTIKTLQRTDVRLREMLEKEDYAGAIELGLECQKAATIFRHYKCISELNSKLQDTLEMIEEQLDIALSKTCNNFDEKHYSKVQHAYRLLGKTQTAMDQLHMHFASTIHNVAFTVVLGYAELCSGTGDGSFQKKQFSDLCKYITHETFTPCLMGLCKALWGVLVNYHKTRAWHETNDGLSLSNSEGVLNDADSSADDNFNRKYVAQKLEHGRVRLWQEIQLKIRTFLLAIDLSNFKFNEFTQILNLVNRLISVGEEFSNSKSEQLQEAIHKQTQNYFHRYHSGCMEEVKMFLENEGWELCPVRTSFTIYQLQDFSFMRGVSSPNHLAVRTKLFAGSDAALSATSVNDVSGVADSSTTGYFSYDSSPFDEQPDEEVQEDFLATNGDDFSSDSDADVANELKADYIDEGLDSYSRSHDPYYRKPTLSRGKSREKDKQLHSPVLTNSSLTVLRQFGKYMRMMTLLEPIAFQVITSMSQLFDFYFYTVYKRFAVNKITEEATELKPGISLKLQTTLKRLTDELQSNGSAVFHDVTSQGSNANLYLLSEKIVAMESLVYLAKQFENLQPHLEKIIPSSKRAFLQQFYSQTIMTISELRYPVYLSATDRLLNQEHIVGLINSVKWDIKEIMSQHNNYVEVILNEFQKFSKRLLEIGQHVPVSADVTAVLWQQCGRLAAQAFVEGYSCVKKCSAEGRALMQLDFQQFLLKFEKITGTRPVAGREYVETYIKAYYYPEDTLDTWVKDHKEYSSKQLVALVNCTPQLSKRVRQKLVFQIEEPDRDPKLMGNSPLVQLQNFAKKHRRDNSTSSRDNFN